MIPPAESAAGVDTPPPALEGIEGRDTALDAQIAEGLGDLSNIDVIRESEKNKPYVGDVESLDSLKQEYINGSQVFVRKIARLQEQYGTMRRTRGDGNCFFRSFIYGYLEWLLVHQQEDECRKFLNCLQSWKQKLVDIGYEPIVFEDPLDMLLQQVQAILIGPGVEGGIDQQQLLINFREDVWSNTCVMLLRFITSAEIKRRLEHFEPFVVGQYEMDVAMFCERSVDVMGEESDHIHAQALCDALQVPIRIIQIDSTTYGSDAAEASVVDVKPEGLSQQEQQQLGEAKVNMLYRPGHYDIIYPKHA